MATHDALYPLILAEAPGCPLITVRLMINRAAAELCTKSMAWTEWLDTVRVRPGRAEYDITLPADSLLVILRQVKWGDRDLRPVMDPRTVPDWETASGEPRGYAMPTRSVLQLYPTPGDDSGGRLRLSAALKPTPDASELPDELVEHYSEALAEGAKSYLKRMPNQPWSDPAGAGAAEQLFRTKIAEARVHTEYGRVQGSLKVKPRRFGR